MQIVLINFIIYNMRNLALSSSLMAIAVSFAAPSTAGLASTNRSDLINKPETPSSQDMAFAPIDFDALQKTEEMTIAQASSTKCCSSGTCDIYTNGPDWCWIWLTHGDYGNWYSNGCS